MQKALWIISLFTLFFFSCKKDTLEVDLTNHENRHIVGEGYFTDSLMKHQFRFSLSTNLGDTDTAFVNEVSMLVKTPTEIIDYVNIGDGLFEAETAFKGEYGEDYTIQFSYNGTIHQIETEMPEPIEVLDYEFVDFDSVSFIPPNSGPITIKLNSDRTQFLKFDLFRGHTDFAGDTIWTKSPIPVYRVVNLSIGDSLNVIIPDDERFIAQGDLAMLKTYIISKDVGDYLVRMRSYITSELVNSQFYNPPYYYSNSAYGLGYGTIVDSVVHQF